MEPLKSFTDRRDLHCQRIGHSGGHSLSAQSHVGWQLRLSNAGHEITQIVQGQVPKKKKAKTLFHHK